MIAPDELTVAEAAAVWGIDRTAAWRVIKKHAAYRYAGRPILIPRTEVERLATNWHKRGSRGKDKRPRKSPQIPKGSDKGSRQNKSPPSLRRRAL